MSLWAELSAPVDELLTAHWARAPRVRHGGPAALSSMGRVPTADDADAFFADTRDLVASGKGIVYASLPHDSWLAGSAPERPYFSVPFDAIAGILGAGASVQINGLEHLRGPFGGIADAGRRLCAEVGHAGPIGIGLTISPPGAGFDAHLDPAGALIVQTSGRKTYRFGRAPLIEHPRAKGFIVAGGRVRFDEEPEDGHVHGSGEMDAAVLGPGDSLYLPAGCVHSTSAQETSWALLFMFMEVGFADVVRDVLAGAFADDPNWRHVPPVGGARSGISSSTRDFAVARLREAADRLEQDIGPALLSRVAHHRVESAALSADPSIRWVADAAMTRIFVGDDELEIEGDWGPFLNALGDLRSIQDAIGLAPNPLTAREVLESLTERGVLDSIRR